MLSGKASSPGCILTRSSWAWLTPGPYSLGPHRPGQYSTTSCCRGPLRTKKESRLQAHIGSVKHQNLQTCCYHVLCTIQLYALALYCTTVKIEQWLCVPPSLHQQAMLPACIMPGGCGGWSNNGVPRLSSHALFCQAEGRLWPVTGKQLLCSCWYKIALNISSYIASITIL